MTALETLQAEERKELQSLALRIKDWQEARQLSVAALLRQYPDLGSDKTFGLLAKGEFGELDIERWLAAYRSAWALMESLRDREEAAEDIYDDISAVAQLRKALMDILSERGITRVVLVEGDSGSGKTSAATALQRRYGSKVLIVEACDATGESAMSFLGDILTALGVTDMPVHKSTRLQMVQRRLKERRVCLVIDEAHHLRPVNLNLLKTLVNTTPGEFVLLALPNLWRKLEHQAYEEVRQLMGNRLAERIRLPDTLREADVRKLLERRANVSDLASIRAVVEAAKRRGNMQFVTQVARRLRDMGLKEAPSREQVLAAIRQQLNRRGEDAQ